MINLIDFKLTLQISDIIFIWCTQAGSFREARRTLVSGHLGTWLKCLTVFFYMIPQSKKSMNIKSTASFRKWNMLRTEYSPVMTDKDTLPVDWKLNWWLYSNWWALLSEAEICRLCSEDFNFSLFFICMDSEHWRVSFKVDVSLFKTYFWRPFARSVIGG